MIPSLEIKEFVRNHFPAVDLTELADVRLETFASASFILHSGVEQDSAFLLYEGEAYLVAPRDLKKGFDQDNMVRIRKYREGDFLNNTEIE